MQTLDKILIAQNAPTQLSVIPTCSRHYKYIKQYMNELLLEYPEYYNLLITIACFPVQKWAMLQRRRLINSANRINNILNDDTFAIMNVVKEKDLELTDTIVEFIDNAINTPDDNINTDVIKASHGYGCKDVTSYILKSHYKNSMIQLCKKYSNQFNKLIKSIEDKYVTIDEDNQLIYHNVEILMKSHQLLNRIINSKNIKAKSINCEQMINDVQQLICSLSHYYNEPELTFQIVSMKYNGESEINIADKLNKSRVYVRNRYKEGITALSYILWGYSTRDILLRLI